MWRRRLMGAALLALAAGAAPASAQRPVRRTIATLALQHGVIGIQATSTGHVVVAASTDAGNATVRLFTGDARELTDSIVRISARPVSRRTTRVYRTVATDAATGAGMQFARHVTKGVSAYRFFFSNGSAAGFPLDVSRRELDLVVHALTRAIAAARTLAAADSA